MLVEEGGLLQTPDGEVFEALGLLEELTEGVEGVVAEMLAREGEDLRGGGGEKFNAAGFPD